MFYSLSIPGILPTRAVRDRVSVAQTQKSEKVHVGMTADKSHEYGIEGQHATPASTDDAQALSMLYEQFRRPIHSYINRLLGNQEDADDVTQEVFVRAFLAWDGLYERHNLSAWLYRIATNLCVDQLRRRKRISWWSLTHRNTHDERFEGDNDDGSWLLPDSGGIPEIAEREHIHLALAQLPEEYAAALVLSAAQGVPYQEIAVIMGISPNAAATRISRAKRMFTEQYHRLSSEGQGLGQQENKR